MLVNFDKTGRVVWYNLYVSKEAAESCLCRQRHLAGYLPTPFSGAKGRLCGISEAE